METCIVIGRKTTLQVVYIPTNTTLGDFITKIKTLNVNTPEDEEDLLGSPDLDIPLNLSTREDVEEMLFICFGNANLRFVRFQDVV
jgi:hypothetical protein